MKGNHQIYWTNAKVVDFQQNCSAFPFVISIVSDNQLTLYTKMGGRAGMNIIISKVNPVIYFTICPSHDYHYFYSLF